MTKSFEFKNHLEIEGGDATLKRGLYGSPK